MKLKGNGGLFALLGYRDTNNIGDEIQSLASRRFLPRVDDVIDRESTDLFHPKDRIPRSMIMNGWYGHAPEHWPPSRFINPLFVALHVSQGSGWYSGLTARDIFLAEPVVKYLRAFAPIGARDLNTLRLLQEAKIDAYFSGCMTLTLERPDVPRNSDLVVLNDLPESVAVWTRSRSKKTIVTTQHTNLYVADQSKRFKKAEDLLNLYASASCVVTSRLHCALPCLAMGTPVLMVNTADDQYRFAGLADFVYNLNVEQILSGALVYDVDNPPPNRDLHHPCCRALVERVEKFVRVHNNRENIQPYPLNVEEMLEIKEFVLQKTSEALMHRTNRVRQLEEKIKNMSVA